MPDEGVILYELTINDKTVGKVVARNVDLYDNGVWLRATDRLDTFYPWHMIIKIQKIAEVKSL